MIQRIHLMNKTTDLKLFKSKKKNEKIVSDISEILKVLTLTQKALSIFKHYVSIQEIISVIATNCTLLELQQKKYEKELQNITK